MKKPSLKKIKLQPGNKTAYLPLAEYGWNEDIFDPYGFQKAKNQLPEATVSSARINPSGYLQGAPMHQMPIQDVTSPIQTNSPEQPQINNTPQDTSNSGYRNTMKVAGGVQQAMGALGGIASGAFSALPALAALIPDNKTQRKNPYPFAQNPFPQGTGSSVLYENGGKIDPLKKKSFVNASSEKNRNIPVPISVKYLEDHPELSGAHPDYLDFQAKEAQKKRGIIAKETKGKKELQEQQRRKIAVNIADEDIGDGTRNKLYNKGNALRERGRLFENATQYGTPTEQYMNLADEYLNPLMWVGNMAANLSEAPKVAKETNSTLPYVSALGAPLAAGAMGFDPLGAGIKNFPMSRLNQSMESGLLSNTHKLNPFAFKPNPSNSYRVIGGEAGLNDALESGLVRANPNGEINPNPLLNRPSDVAYYEKGKIGNYPGEYIAETNKPTYYKGEINPVTGKQIKGRHYGAAPYNEAGQKYNLPIEDVTFMKKNWLQGYKEIPKKEFGGKMAKNGIKVITDDGSEYIDPSAPKEIDTPIQTQFGNVRLATGSDYMSPTLPRDDNMSFLNTSFRSMSLPPTPKNNSIKYEELLMGNTPVYSPTFQGNWNNSDMRGIWDQLPSKLNDRPVLRGQQWEDLQMYKNGGTLEVGQELDLTEEEIEMYKKMGYKFQ